MGTPMASNLVKAGHRLMVYDANPERTALLSALAGARSLQSPRLRAAP